VKEFTDFLFSGDVAIQDLHTGAASLAANSKARGLLWEYIKNNWDFVYQKMASNNVVFERFIRLSLSKFSDQAVEQDIAAFFKDKDTGGYDRGLVVASDTVRSNANYKKRDEKLVLEWLQAHGYA
jgi:aminopeptidase N